MNLLLLIVIGLPLVAAAVLLVSPSAEEFAGWVAVGATSITAVAAFLTLLAQPWRRPLTLDLPWIPSLGVRASLLLDGISAPFLVLTCLLGVAVMILLPTTTGRPPRRALVAALLSVQAGATLTFIAADTVVFFIAFELSLIPMWAIIRWWGSAPGAPHAALRFVLFMAAGSALLLAGILLVAQDAGTDLVALASAQGSGLDRSTQVIAAALILAGLAIKVPSWPVHSWLPPAHTAAPTVGSILLAGVLLKMGTYGMVRLVLPVLPEGFVAVSPYLGALAVISIFWAGLACLVEPDLKRLIALSSVAHMGFVTLGIASGTATGLQGALLANIAHGIISALLFLVAGGLKDRGATAIAAVAGLRDRRPRLGALLALGAIAGLGMPGLAGFWGEFLVILGSWGGRTGTDLAYWRSLAALALLGTALATGYMLRILRHCWQRPAAGLPDPQSASEATPAEWRVGLALAAAVVTLGLAPWLVLHLTEGGVQELVAALLRGVI